MGRNGRKTEFSFCELANTGKKIFTFCAITFEPIEVQTRSSPQNDRLNLYFVKDTYVDGKKLARNGRKMASYHSASFPPHYRRTLLTALSFFLCD